MVTVSYQAVTKATHGVKTWSSKWVLQVSTFYITCKFRLFIRIQIVAVGRCQRKWWLLFLGLYHINSMEILKSRPNDRNISSQHIPTLLDHVETCCEGLAKRTQHHATIYAIFSEYLYAYPLDGRNRSPSVSYPLENVLVNVRCINLTVSSKSQNVRGESESISH